MKNKVSGISITVQEVRGKCVLEHKPGDRVIITENGVDGRICIHALYSLLPAAFAMLYDVEFPWLEDKSVKKHACPDASNQVIFELRKIREN